MERGRKYRLLYGSPRLQVALPFYLRALRLKRNTESPGFCRSSPSVVLAAQAAHAKGMSVVGLTGRRGSQLEQCADICICTSAGRYADRVQELHIKIIHILIELVERALQPSNYLPKK